MTYRMIDTKIWDDPWFESLSVKAKCFFLYSWTNKSCDQAGMYEISLKRLEFDIGFKVTGDILEEASPKVIWFDDDNILWVRKFFKYQCHNQKFAVSALKKVESLPDKYKASFVDYNLEILGQYTSLEIPYIEGIDRVCIPGIRTVQNDSYSKVKNSTEQYSKEKKILKEKPAIEIYDLYIEKIKPKKPTREAAIKNIKILLKKYPFEDLKKSAINYEQSQTEDDKKYPYAAHNFFGQVKAYYKDYLPGVYKPMEKPDEPYYPYHKPLKPLRDDE